MCYALKMIGSGLDQSKRELLMPKGVYIRKGKRVTNKAKKRFYNTGMRGVNVARIPVTDYTPASTCTTTCIPLLDVKMSELPKLIKMGAVVLYATEPPGFED